MYLVVGVFITKYLIEGETRGEAKTSFAAECLYNRGIRATHHKPGYPKINQVHAPFPLVDGMTHRLHLGDLPLRSYQDLKIDTKRLKAKRMDIRVRFLTSDEDK